MASCNGHEIQTATKCPVTEREGPDAAVDRYADAHILYCHFADPLFSSAELLRMENRPEIPNESF
jgi:hypothetical protein